MERPAEDDRIGPSSVLCHHRGGVALDVSAQRLHAGRLGARRPGVDVAFHLRCPIVLFRPDCVGACGG